MERLYLVKKEAGLMNLEKDDLVFLTTLLLDMATDNMCMSIEVVTIRGILAGQYRLGTCVCNETDSKNVDPDENPLIIKYGSNKS